MTDSEFQNSEPASAPSPPIFTEKLMTAEELFKANAANDGTLVRNPETIPPGISSSLPDGGFL
jgi:hypothetical protein